MPPYLEARGARHPRGAARVAHGRAERARGSGEQGEEARGDGEERRRRGAHYFTNVAGRVFSSMSGCSCCWGRFKEQRVH